MRHFQKMIASIITAALVACAAGAFPASAGDTSGASEPLHIATKPMTEQYILGEMLKCLIEEKTEYTCEITKGIGGGTSNIMPAMESGDFDLYPEYTSTGYVLVLGHEAKEAGDEEMWEQLLAEYHEQYGMTWLAHYGFNNTYCLTVRGEVAREYNLKTCSDMTAVADRLVFGGNPDYIEREDGFPAVCSTYGYEFKDIASIDIGLKYAALASGSIDVTNGYTTDAQLGVQDVVALEDDKHLQVNYFCSTVVREDTLESHPGLEEALMLMEGILSDSEMASLNAQVEADGKDEAAVARDYLIEKGILEA